MTSDLRGWLRQDGPAYLVACTIGATLGLWIEMAVPLGPFRGVFRR